MMITILLNFKAQTLLHPKPTYTFFGLLVQIVDLLYDGTAQLLLQRIMFLDVLPLQSQLAQENIRSIFHLCPSIPRHKLRIKTIHGIKLGCPHHKLNIEPTRSFL